MSTYNVSATTAEKLWQLLEQFPSITIEESFSKTDWNVNIPDDPGYEDKFVEWCEENEVTYLYV